MSIDPRLSAHFNGAILKSWVDALRIDGMIDGFIDEDLMVPFHWTPKPSTSVDMISWIG